MNWVGVDWGSLARMIAGIGVILGQTKLQERHPLHPWAGIGSGAFVRVENTGDRPLTVTFVAPGFDMTPRSQIVAPHREDFLKSPYTDCVVLVIIGRDTTRLRIERPGIYPLNKDKWQ